MIDVGTLHQHNLFFHHLTGNGVPYSRIGFVAVHSFQFDRLSVHIIITSGKSEFIFGGRSILNLHFAETDNGGNHFNGSVLLILQFGYQRVAIRKFSRPLIRSLYLKNSLNTTGFIRSDFVDHRR